MSFLSPKDFYERYKGDDEEARRAAFKIGQDLASVLMQRLGVQGGNLESLAAVLNEFQRMVQGEPNAKVEGTRVTMSCTGFCPVMRAALTLDIPWTWLDTRMAWPMFEGMASHIMASATLSLPLAKSRGDPACDYVFEI